MRNRGPQRSPETKRGPSQRLGRCADSGSHREARKPPGAARPAHRERLCVGPEEEVFAEECGERRWGSRGKASRLNLGVGAAPCADPGALLRQLHPPGRPPRGGRSSPRPTPRRRRPSSRGRAAPVRGAPRAPAPPLRVLQEGPPFVPRDGKCAGAVLQLSRDGWVGDAPMLNHCFLHSRYGSVEIFPFKRKQVIICKLSSAVYKVSQFKKTKTHSIIFPLFSVSSGVLFS